MEITQNSIVSDVVKANFKTAYVFEKYNINFCCGGGITLAEACQQTGTDSGQLLSDLEAMFVNNEPDSGYINSLNPDELCDYIEKRHHSYIKETLPYLQEKLQHLCEDHGEEFPELYEINSLFDGAASNLNAHINEQELLLFPSIRKLVKSGNDHSRLNGDESGKIKRITEIMKDEHQIEGERFERIAYLSKDYECPPDGCNTHRVTYQTLREFDKDLRNHFNLENNILFEKAVALENELTSG